MNYRRALLAAFALVAMSGGSVSTWAGDWTAWRGVSGSGVSQETNLPVSWSAGKNLAWSLELPGRGNSSPAVTAKSVYLTTQTEDDGLWVLAIDRPVGKFRWKEKVGSGKLVTYGPENLYAHRHNPATPSPVADEQMVWAMFGTGLCVAFDRNGKELWRRDLVKEYGKYQVRFGMASSPRLWGDLLYIACMQKGPVSYVVALNKKTGKEVWKTSRKLPAKDDGPDAYSSPVVWQSGGKAALVVSGSDHLNAYDLLSGKQLWISSGLTINSQYGRIIASPAVSPGVVVACSANPPGAPGHAIAVRTDGSGDVTKTHRLWRYTPYTSDSPTPVCYRGRLYMVRDDGVASILDLQTGKVHWRERLEGGTYRSATVAGDGKVYFLARDGECTVMEAGTDGKVLSRNKLKGSFFSTPAISDGRLYLRAHKKLYVVAAEKDA